MFDSDKESFRRWLREEKQLSNRVVGDIVSRCNRLDKQVLTSISESVSSISNYIAALNDIEDYAKKNKHEKSSQQSLAATLRGAIRKYCEFVNPDTYEEFPTKYYLK